VGDLAFVFGDVVFLLAPSHGTRISSLLVVSARVEV
jgi:hypothetical protein